MGRKGGSDVKDVDGAQVDSPRDVPGLGIDIGTANLVVAGQLGGNTNIRWMRNMFLDIDDDKNSVKMLDRMGVRYAKRGKKLSVLGKDAYELARIFNEEVRRPMRAGMISSAERDAIPLVRLMVDKLAGQPMVRGEKAFYSVPANPIDSSMDANYHGAVFSSILTDLGYSPEALPEGHAVGLAELGDSEYTGIAMSFGGGMTNVGVLYRGIAPLTFSVARGGDWVDESVAKVLGTTVPKAIAIKEDDGMDIGRPANEEQRAVSVYYANLIKYTFENILSMFQRTGSLPDFDSPVDIVCAGGGSLVKGFIERVKSVYCELEFPLKIREIRVSDDPFTSVARGCLIEALS